MAVFRIEKAELQRCSKLRISGINFYLINLNNYKILNNAILFILMGTLNFRTNKLINNNSLNCINLQNICLENTPIRRSVVTIRNNDDIIFNETWTWPPQFTPLVPGEQKYRPSFHTTDARFGNVTRRFYQAFESVIGVNTGSNRSRGDISISNHLSEAIYY